MERRTTILHYITGQFDPFNPHEIAGSIVTKPRLKVSSIRLDFVEKRVPKRLGHYRRPLYSQALRREYRMTNGSRYLRKIERRRYKYAIKGLLRYPNLKHRCRRLRNQKAEFFPRVQRTTSTGGRPFIVTTFF